VALAVGDGDALLGGDGVDVGVSVMLGLAGAAAIVGTVVGVDETSGGAHVSASDAATARCKGAVSAHRATCSPMETATRSIGR
jgi:hypothetical protein